MLVHCSYVEKNLGFHSTLPAANNRRFKSSIGQDVFFFFLMVQTFIHSTVSVWVHWHVQCCCQKHSHLIHRIEKTRFRWGCFWLFWGLTLLLPWLEARGQMFMSWRNRIDWTPSIYINIFLCSVGSSRFGLMFPLTLPLFLLIVRGRREYIQSHKTKIHLAMSHSDFLL